MSTNYRKVAMSLDDLPRQRLFQLLDLPAPPPDFQLLDTRALEKLQPSSPDEDASLVLQAEWAWSPMHGRISNWEIGLDETRRYWALWCSFRTDDCEPAEWCDPDCDEKDIEWVRVWYSELVAACPCAGVSIQDAGILLLSHAWEQERDGEMELDRPHFYTATGILDIDVIRSIERAVWE